MDPDKNLSGDSGGPGWQQRGQPDSPSEHRDPRFTTFEQVRFEEIEVKSVSQSVGRFTSQVSALGLVLFYLLIIFDFSIVLLGLFGRIRTGFCGRWSWGSERWRVWDVKGRLRWYLEVIECKTRWKRCEFNVTIAQLYLLNYEYIFHEWWVQKNPFFSRDIATFLLINTPSENKH